MAKKVKKTTPPRKAKAVKPKAKSGSPSGSAAANFVKDVSAKAERLHKLRKGIDAMKEKQRIELEARFAEVSTLKAEVLSGLKLIGLSSVKVRGGASYYISKTHGFQVKSQIHLDGWAREKGLVRPDMDRVKQELKKLAKAEKLPSFVEPVDGETISYRSNKPAKGDDHE